MRSSSGRPDAWYFLAIDTTSRRFDCTNCALGVLALARPCGAARACLAGVSVLAGVVELGERRVAGFDRLREPDLVVLGQQWVLPDVGEVETDEVFLVPIDSLFGHRQLPQCGLTSSGRWT